METFKKRGVSEKKPIKEHWEKTGKAPTGVKCVDANEGDAKNPERRSRLAAKEIECGKMADLPRRRRWRRRRCCSRRGRACRTRAWNSPTL